ncbi:MAG: hypothetical protein IGR92_04300 [Leptolyngbyaceae cyanobacterium T60_A2020_046]|nr:hypothetical protein [Leptolyngbyaceae cyanobacterium T60_A2020_046]
MNFGTPVPLLIGIILIVSAICLFFLDKLKPGYERDSDKVYSILCLLSGIFLLGNLTMDLIPSFQQLIMTGMLIALMIENIRTRTPNSARAMPQDGPDIQPSRGDGYRPTPRADYRSNPRMNVRAELENDRYGRDRFAPPRPALGSRDDRNARRSAYPEDDYLDQYDDRELGDRRSYAYGSGSPRSDDRIRRRRPPLQLRGDVAGEPPTGPYSPSYREPSRPERRPSPSSYDPLSGEDDVAAPDVRSSDRRRSGNNGSAPASDDYSPGYDRY